MVRQALLHLLFNAINNNTIYLTIHICHDIFYIFRYYKTVAAQEPGEDNILSASYGKIFKDVSMSTHLLPQFGTDYGLCR